MQPCEQQHRLTELEKVISDLKKVPADVTEIKNELLGTPYTQGKGLIHAVQETKADILKMKERYALDRAYVYGAAAGITLIVSIIFNIITA